MARNSGVLQAGNIDIMNAIRNGATLDYQRRIPATTQANMKDNIEAITSDRMVRNQFIDALVNRIGTVIARNTVWDNPLSVFKRGMLTFGDTIEDVITGLVQSKEYSFKHDYESDLFKRHNVDVRSIFHKVTREEYYAITVNDMALRRAFLDDGGLSEFVNTLMSAPTTSDNWDEYLLTVSLFRQFEEQNGFYKVQVPNLNTLSATDSDAKAMLKRVRAMSSKLKILSTKYNPAGMPVFARPEDTVLFATPEVVANLDVEALAAAFNMDRAQVAMRIIEVPAEHFGIANCQAILTTDEFFVIADTVLENTSQYNPVSLGTNYFLHHHEIISCSQFVPAIMFTSDTVSDPVVIAPANVALGTATVTDANGENVTSAMPGSNVKVSFPITGDNLDAYEIGVDYDVSGAKSDKTMINNDGVLSIGDDETGTPLTVTGTVTYRPIDTPGATPSSATREVTVTVSAARPAWPPRA